MNCRTDVFLSFRNKFHIKSLLQSVVMNEPKVHVANIQHTQNLSLKGMQQV